MDSKLVKERENDLSQLNRLGVAYFLVVYFRFLPLITSALLSFKSVGAQMSASFFLFAQFLADERNSLSRSSDSS
jgi:hypothetical protein